jgi:hypothetical protein
MARHLQATPEITGAFIDLVSRHHDRIAFRFAVDGDTVLHAWNAWNRPAGIDLTDLTPAQLADLRRAAVLAAVGAGLTTRRVARLAGVSRRDVDRWRAGRADPAPGVGQRISSGGNSGACGPLRDVPSRGAKRRSTTALSPTRTDTPDRPRADVAWPRCIHSHGCRQT